MRFGKNIIVLLVFCFFAGIVFGQQGTGFQARSNAAQYYLGSENELLIPINIWGFVHKPGQYMVPNNTDLVSLISFAGGPTEDGKISNVQVVRSNLQAESQVYKINIQKYLDSGNSDLIPILKPGDTIVVRATGLYWMSRFFEFISRLAVFAQIIYFVAVAQDYFER